MKGFVYKTVNLINGMYYIGAHKENGNDEYLGSGNYINKAIEKYGRENFSREIIEHFDDINDAYLLEEKLVNDEIVNDPMSYNLCLGGKGKVGNLIPNEDTRKRMSESHKKRYYKNGNPNKGRKRGPHSEEHSKKISESRKGHPTATGRKLSNETKEKMRQSALNRTKYNCPVCDLCNLDGGLFTKHCRHKHGMCDEDIRNSRNKQEKIQKGGTKK